MAGLYIILPLLGLVSPHNVGIILNSEHIGEEHAIRRVMDFTLSNLDDSTEINLITKAYTSVYLSLYDTVCALLEENVTVLVTASGSGSTAIEADIASQFHVPLIAAVATDPYLKTADRDYLITLSPSDRYQSKAIFDILKHFQWFKFSILASADNYGMNGVIYLQHLATRDSSFTILDVQHFEVIKDLERFDVTKELRLLKSSLTRVVVLNCHGEYAKVIFREAEAMGLMDEGFIWIVTDGITGEPEALSYDGSFLSYYTGIIGIVPCLGEGTDGYNSFKDRYIKQHAGASSTDITMSSIKVSDALTAVHKTLAGLDLAGTDWDSVPSVSCFSTEVWDGGAVMFDRINGNAHSGISGDIFLDSQGVVTNSSYDIMNFVKDSFIKVGSWTNSSSIPLTFGNSIVFIGGSTTPPSGVSSTLTGFHLRVSIVREPPIAYHIEGGSCLNDTSSPDCWFGWNPDIIKKLAGDLNFTYEYVQPDDLKYGGFDHATQTWNGMVKDILDKKTDLTTAISINTERSAYIHFTLSFFENQASFVVSTAGKSGSANMFFFLLPFKISIWVSLFGMIGVLAFCVTLFSKLSPFGTYGRQIYAQQSCSCDQCQARRELKDKLNCRFADTKENGCLVGVVEEDDPLDTMSFYNSLWTVSTGLVQQGGESLPQAPSGRLLLFFWWLFVMILVSMYTANLAAYLTLEASTISITSLTDLLEQAEYEWGVIADRNLESMMKNHQDERFTDLVDRGTKLLNLEEGISRVKEGGFVFIDEGSVLSFNFMDDCSAVQTKTDMFSNEWAFGLQPNSPYEDLINQMFLKYREEGWFTDKWDEWYKSETKCKTAVGGEDMRFDIPILSGLYCIFAMGIASSFVLVFLETLYAAHLDSKNRDGGGFWACLMRRLKLKKKEICEEWLGKERNPHDVSSGLDNRYNGNSRIIKE